MLTITIATTLILAALWGWIEGQWINRRTKASGPAIRGHFFLGAGRAVLVLLVVYFVQHGYGLHPSITLWLLIMAGALFVTVHRLALNITRHAAYARIPIWWMGEWDGEGSFYDEAWHWIAWLVSGQKVEAGKSFSQTELKYRARKIPAKEGLPFILAMAAEVGIAVIAALLIHLN